MVYDYGYDDFVNKLLGLFRAGDPDFVAVEELIQLGAELNAAGRYEDENILSEILSGYWCVSNECTNGENCGKGSCAVCERNTSPNSGQSMCEIIRFFLEHGFYVAKDEGCYGAQCLWALTLSTFDHHMIEATKILLDAGAKNRTVSLVSTDADKTPWSFMAMEGSLQGTCEHNHSVANIYEAV